MNDGESGVTPGIPATRRLRLPKPLVWALKILAASACVYLVFRKVPWPQVGPALGKCDFRYIALAVALQYLAAVANALRWKTLLRHPDLGLLKYLHYVLLGQFFNLFLPTYIASEAVKVVAFGRKYGGTQENIGIALLSKTTGMFVQMAMGGIGLVLYARELREHGLFTRLHLDARAAWAAGALATGALAAAWIFRNRLFRQKWFHTMVLIARDKKLVAKTLAWTLVIQFLAAACSYSLFLSLYPATHFWHVVLFTTIILALLSLPFGFGGMGVREYLNLLLFTDVGGIPAHITFAVNIVGYLPVFAVALTGGAWMALRRLRE